MKMDAAVETKVSSYTGSALSKKKQSSRKIDEMPEQSLTKTVNVQYSTEDHGDIERAETGR